MSTYTIFKSTKLEFTVNNEGEKHVKCIKDIRNGELLLLEHCIYQEMDTNDNLLIDMIRHNEDLFNTLTPYDTKWSHECVATQASEDIIELIHKKIQQNSLGFEKKLMIGKDISGFYSTTIDKFNAVVWTIPIDIELPVVCMIVSVFAINDIKKDDDVVINNEFDDEIDYSAYIQPILAQYIKKTEFKIIMVIQLSMFHGLFMIDETISPTQKFKDYITNLYGEFDLETIEKWIASSMLSIDKLVM